MLNNSAFQIFQDAFQSATSLGCRPSSIAGASILDAGVECPGSLSAGILLARLCMGDRADVSLVPATGNQLASNNAIYVRTDDPVQATLAAQYAGWPIQADDFFAMGSGPMRVARGREQVLQHLNLSESPERVVGVLEADKLPTEATVELVAKECGVECSGVCLAVAPTSSIAGSLQVVARSIETAMHKLHALKFDVASIVTATGQAPMPPPAKPGDMVAGIGRTNDAILYGATVTLWVDQDDDAIEAVIDGVPSSGSGDYGQPFAKIFEQYEFDFYKVDPMLFSPAMVTFHNLRSGRTWTRGKINSEVLRRSFLT